MAGSGWMVDGCMWLDGCGRTDVDDGTRFMRWGVQGWADTDGQTRMDGCGWMDANGCTWWPGEDSPGSGWPEPLNGCDWDGESQLPATIATGPKPEEMWDGEGCWDNAEGGEEEEEEEEEDNRDGKEDIPPVTEQAYADSALKPSYAPLKPSYAPAGAAASPPILCDSA
jgi:hypothetical protein